MNSHRKFRIMADNADSINESRYTIEEVVEMIDNGVIALSTNTIKGINGANFTRMPAVYESKNGEWFHTTFTFGNREFPITTLKENENIWYHFPQILKMLGLYTNDSDSRAFEVSIPYELKRFYSPFGRGIKRMFVNPEALEFFGLSMDGKPIVKRKVSLQFSGVTIYNVNLEYLTDNINRIINQVKSLDDKMFLCDVYRVLKQL